MNTEGERSLYNPIGEWLVQNKGCQRNDFFRGYCKEPEIAGHRPDVVGARYQRRNQKYPAYDFHFCFVEIKQSIGSQKKNNLKGEVDTLIRAVSDPNTKTCLDSAQYYIAFPSDSVSKDILDWAREKGAGVLRIELGKQIQPHEVVEPKTFERPLKRSSILSNKKQRSAGKFEEGVKKCPVLRRIMKPSEFYEQNIRPEIKKLKEEQEMGKALRYPADEEVKKYVKELIDFIKELNLPIETEGWNENIFIYKEEATRSEFALKIVPQKRNFKVLDSEGDTICRVCSRTEIELNEEMENLEDLKVYVKETLERSF